MLNRIVFSSNTWHWHTDPVLYAKLDSAWHFKCDPCTSMKNHLGAPLFYYDRRDCLRYWSDGLVQPWDSPSFLNPPYGRMSIDWIRLAFLHYQQLDIASVLLLPSRTGVAWSQKFILSNAQAVCFMEGRQDFKNPGRAEDDHFSAPFDSMIAVFQPEPLTDLQLKVLRSEGTVMKVLN